MSGDRVSIIDRYARVLEEEGAEALRRLLSAVEDRLRFGVSERGERPVFQDEVAVSRQAGESARARAGSTPPDLLLLTLGYSPEPLLLAVAYHAPREVALLGAELDQTYLARFAALWDSCRDQLGQPPFAELRRRMRVVRDSEGAFFQAVRDVVEARRRAGSSAILLDITGAKKTMIAGAFLAAGYLDVEVSYVDFDSYDFLLHRPDPGTSRPRLLTHPLRLFRLREEERLIVAFDRRRFEEAAALAGSLAETAASPEVIEILGEAALPGAWPALRRVGCPHAGGAW